MRVDANVSVRPEGSDELRTRCEIKNLNSLRSLGRAIEYEATRQADLHSASEKVVQETRHWDDTDGRTHTMRSKEEADDYRYFPEPDLVPVDPDPAWVTEIAASLPMLPQARRHRLADVTGEAVSAESIVVIVDRNQDSQALLAMAVAGGHWRHVADVESGSGTAEVYTGDSEARSHGHEAGDAGELAAAAAAASDAVKARVMVHVAQNLSGEGGAELSAERLAELVNLEVAGELTATQAKQVLVDLVADSSVTAAEVAAAKGFEAMDTDALETVVDQVIAASAAEWQQFCEGDDKARKKLSGFFTGKIMKATKGQADGRAVARLLAEKAD